MNCLANPFQAQVDQFPESARSILGAIPHQAGWLDALQCSQLMRLLDIGPDELMVRLLPLACCYAVTPASHFQTGAVAMAATGGEGGGSLFIGANMEFTHLALNQTVHAEQAAVINAWHHGVNRIEALAVTAVPCGYCRQFLFEIENTATMRIVTPSRQKGGCRHAFLEDLLPEAFTPMVLGREARFMALSSRSRTIRLPAFARDRLVAGACEAAENSYAPYTHNYAGCAIQTGQGEIYSGRCMESVAHNPGLIALQCAIMMVHLACVDPPPSVERVVLVEKQTTASQRSLSEVLLRSWAPGIELEYVEAS